MTETTVPVVRPSWLVGTVMRPMTRVLNPVMRRLAGRRHPGMLVTIVHTGRRSGRRYTTTTGGRLARGSVLVPLTFGTGSDWCRNVLAAHGAALTLGGATYDATRPRVVRWADEPDAVRAAFPAVLRGMLRLFGIKAFLAMDVAPHANLSRP